MARVNRLMPPGYFLLLNLWGRAVSWEPAALRVLSLLVGALGVCMTYRLGRDLFGKRMGLASAALLGTSSMVVYYMHELRMYAAVPFLTALMLWAYFRVVNSSEKQGVGVWLALLAGAAGLLYTHYFAGIAVIALGGYHLLFAPKTRRWWQVTGLLIVAGLLFLPWGIAVLTAGGGGTTGESENALRVLDAIYRIGMNFANGNFLAFALVCVFALMARSSNARRVIILTLLLLLLYIVANVALQVLHGGRLRYVLALWTPLALVSAIGLRQLSRWRVKDRLVRRTRRVHRAHRRRPVREYLRA